MRRDSDHPASFLKGLQGGVARARTGGKRDASGPGGLPPVHLTGPPPPRPGCRRALSNVADTYALPAPARRACAVLTTLQALSSHAFRSSR